MSLPITFSARIRSSSYCLDWAASSAGMNFLVYWKSPFRWLSSDVSWHPTGCLRLEHLEREIIKVRFVKSENKQMLLFNRTERKREHEPCTWSLFNEHIFRVHWLPKGSRNWGVGSCQYNQRNQQQQCVQENVENFLVLDGLRRPNFTAFVFA